MTSSDFRKEHYWVDDVPHALASEFIRRHHYAKGCSKQRVYAHGLFDGCCGELVGVVMWLPPTRVACESVNAKQWQKVLSLSRMAIKPGIPVNACSFLLGKSIKAIKRDRRFVSLVTYADESQGHTGGVYKAANWTYVGKMRAQTRWVDADGKQVAQQSTTTRTRAEMLALGYIDSGRFHKHKYIMHLTNDMPVVYASKHEF